MPCPCQGTGFTNIVDTLLHSWLVSWKKMPINTYPAARNNGTCRKTTTVQCIENMMLILFVD